MAIAKTTAHRERGAVLVLGCFIIAALVAAVALTADGFMLVQSYLMAHNAAEYGAEAGLRRFIKCASTGAPCGCNDFNCLRHKGCTRANEISYYLIFGQQTPTYDCSSNNNEVQIGLWDEHGASFTPATDTVEDMNELKNGPRFPAARVEVTAHLPRLFFAGIFGIYQSSVRAEAIVFRKTNDGLYPYRLAKPFSLSSSSTSSSSISFATSSESSYSTSS